jgi:tetratricopeptide (TPR) repeat protein
VVTVDLGALDGLAKDRELEVVHGDAVAARLVVLTVFRERAEARAIGESSVALNDVVQVPAAEHLHALLDRSAAQFARGEAEAARATAQKAVDFGERADLPQRTEAWNRLGVLLMLAGQYDAAGTPLRHAVAMLSRTDPLYRECVNNLAVLAEVAHDPSKAAELYATALASLSTDAADDRRVIESNLSRVRGSQ